MKRYMLIGGHSGIGEKLTEKLLQSGVIVDTLSRSSPDATWQCDVLDINIPLPDLTEKYDGFVYFPGTIYLKPFKQLTLDNFRHDWEVNFFGAVRVLQHLLPHLNDGASIVLMSTVAAKVGLPFHASIASAKGAIEGLTHSLAAELSPKIRVNAVAPSLTKTPLSTALTGTDEKIESAAKLHPMQRVGTPEDIAQAIAFLLSSESNWITGQVIHCDGGFSTLRQP